MAYAHIEPSANIIGPHTVLEKRIPYVVVVGLI